VRQPESDEDALAAGDAEILQTREDISETLEAIQAKLDPERLTDDAKEAAKETVDHVVDEVRTTVQESSELASVAAMEAVDYALLKVKESLPDLSQQAQEAAQDAVDHAIAEAKAAVRELGSQTRAAVRDATIGRVERMANTTSESSKYVGSTIVHTIKQNPGPAALTALGLGWLIMNGRGSGGQAGTRPTAQPYGGQGTTGLGAQVQSTVGQATETVGDATGRVQAGLSGAADQVQQTATEVAGQVQHTATDVAGQVQTTVTNAAEKAQQTAGELASQAQQVPSRFRQMIEQNPVALGLVAAAVGGAVALAVPETRRENELLGEARDTLIDRAQTTAQTAVEKVQRVAEEVGETVEKEAKYQGLSTET